MIDEWQYSTFHKSPCKVIEEQTLCGQTICCVWLPNQNVVVRVLKSSLQSLNAEFQLDIEAERIAYIAAAAKVAEVLEDSTSASKGHVLLAPMESNVIPLPHQIHVLSRAVSGDSIRYFLADEVGLGKTIEAGLIMRELKLRGLVRRTLIVSPKGIATQWVSEMKTHFNEQFQLVLGDEISTLQRITRTAKQNSSVWSMFDQIIVSLDSVKPIDSRRGWTAEHVAEYNRSRFEDLITADWDLVIVDEAHRLGGSTDQVARYKLGQGLAEASPYLLLLSATPHQGKSDAFHRLMKLLDDNAFPDMDSVCCDRIAPYVIRTEKRKAIDTNGNLLFKPRHTQMVSVIWESRHHLQQQLYTAVTNYVREGYNQALLEKKRYIGFLLILMQRLVVSSTRAIRTTLERRLAVLKDNQKEATLRLAELENDADNFDNFEELYDMNGQELLDILLKSHIAAMKNEGKHIEELLDMAIRCEHTGADAKAEALIEWIYKLQSEENEPDLKILIFTEFIPTQKMLKEFLETRGISVVILNGTMDMDERKQAQDTFCTSHRVLVSTDAGGEGLNLQFAHIVINFDIPWNPMRLEQRIGRVDRIGQSKRVRAINFLFKNSVEFRVREVLEQKLAVIFKEFGIDKTGDVLDSAQAGLLFEDVFTSAILSSTGIRSSINCAVAKIRNEIRQVHESSATYGISEKPDIQTAERLRSHPLPHWIERMTVSYLNSHGGMATPKHSWWDLNWPDGQKYSKCVFNASDANHLTDSTLLNLENSTIRELALNLPQMIAGQLIPCIIIDGLPSTVSGFWGLFEIRLQGGLHKKTQLLRIPMIKRKYFSVFVSEDGKLFMPTARHIWDAVQTAKIHVQTTLDFNNSIDTYKQLYNVAEEVSQELFETMEQSYSTSIDKEKERGMTYFSSRRKTIARIGLPEVKEYRLNNCNTEEADWQQELKLAQQIVPEIRPLMMLNIITGALNE